MNTHQKIAGLLILLVATVLRFYQYHDLQYSHDEISALQRTGYSTFEQLIVDGVKIEGHPAGVQVFLHYYTQWFGYSEIIVKLPFVLMGIAGIALIIALGWQIKKVNAALLTAACMAVMQYFIMYSQLARPYGFGLFFSILAGYFWFSYFYSKPKTRQLLGFSLAAAGAAYSHQFSLLFIALMGLSGLFKIQRQQILPYLLSCAGILLLYAPHLPVFFHQLSLGGVESWLAKPGLLFPIKYLGYLFHYSWWFGLAGLLSLFFTIRIPTSKFPWEGILWFGLSLGIGYFYSVYVNAVLQYSVLLFAAPFLLFSLFSLGEIKRPLLFSSIILICGSLTLFATRQHYPLFYQSPFAYPLQRMLELEEKGKDPILIHDLEAKKMEFYRSKWGISSSSTFALSGEGDYGSALRFALNSHSQTVLLALGDSRQRELPHFMQPYFSKVEKQENLFNLTLWELEKGDGKNVNALWGQDFSKPLDSVQAHDLYSSGIEIELPTEKIKHQEDYFISRWEIQAGQRFEKTEIASAIYLKDSLISWQTSPLAPYQVDKGFTAYHSFYLPAKYHGIEGLRLKLFLYNHDKAAFKARPLDLKLHPGNHKVFGLYYPF